MTTSLFARAGVVNSTVSVRLFRLALTSVKAAITVTRCLNIYRSILRLEKLVHLAITAFTAYRLGCLKMALHLTLHGGVEGVFQYLMECTILAKQGLANLELLIGLRQTSSCTLLVSLY